MVEERDMNDNLYTFLAVCSFFLAGCGRVGQGPKAMVQEEEPHNMIQIQNLSLTDKILTLDYQILNPFDDDIWICYDIWVHDEQGAQDTSVRIDGDSVRILLRYNLESVGGMVLENPPGVAKYVRLRPEESCSGKIIQNLPIGDYAREPQAESKEHKKILHRVVFEVGYFGPEMKELFDSWSEKIKKEPDKYKPLIAGRYYYLSISPFITEEPLDGKLREVMYIEEYTPIIRKEESTEATITDVNIPGN